MIKLIEDIRLNLRAFAYPNEASISHGIVTHILQALGWNTASPAQLVPEYTVDRRRVDFALLGAGRKPTVFIEVKGQGLAAQGDRQLFEYAFHDGVPLCVLTDGAEWSFYLPGGQGSYEDRRVYRLQLDERSSEECQAILSRYLQRERVCSGRAYEDAQSDYRDAASRREAVAALPLAWHELLSEPDGTLMSLLSVKAESLCGFAPSEDDVLSFLLQLSEGQGSAPRPRTKISPAISLSAATAQSAPPAAAPAESNSGLISATLFGEAYSFETAKDAFVRLLGLITARDPGRIRSWLHRYAKASGFTSPAVLVRSTRSGRTLPVRPSSSPAGS